MVDCMEAPPPPIPSPPPVLLCFPLLPPPLSQGRATPLATKEPLFSGDAILRITPLLKSGSLLAKRAMNIKKIPVIRLGCIHYSENRAGTEEQLFASQESNEYKKDSCNPAWLYPLLWCTGGNYILIFASLSRTAASY